MDNAIHWHRKMNNPPFYWLLFRFREGTDILTTSVKNQLDELAAKMVNDSTSEYKLVGHASRVGSAPVNERLSRQRAQAVANYLIGQHAIESERLRVEGRGFNDPLPDVDPSAGIQRRVEIYQVP